MRKNKYEDIEMIDLDNKVDDILEIYINRLYSTDKTVGIVINKETAEYFLDELVKIEETSIKEVCFVDNVDIDEYLVSVDDNGWIRVIPIDNHSVIDDVDIVYIDMDGNISQNVVDYYVNEDKEVILFGQNDDCDGECENCECNKPSTTSTATYKVNGKEVSEDEYISELERKLNDLSEWFDIATLIVNFNRVMNNRLNRLRKFDDLLL